VFVHLALGRGECVEPLFAGVCPGCPDDDIDCTVTSAPAFSWTASSATPNLRALADETHLPLLATALDPDWGAVDEPVFQ